MPIGCGARAKDMVVDYRTSRGERRGLGVVEGGGAVSDESGGVGGPREEERKKVVSRERCR